MKFFVLIIFLSGGAYLYSHNKADNVKVGAYDTCTELGNNISVCKCFSEVVVNELGGDLFMVKALLNSNSKDIANKGYIRAFSIAAEQCEINNKEEFIEGLTN